VIVCASCGEENPERARFCLACGSPLAHEAPVGEERKVVSVLFVDLVGFTSRSDRADPEDVRATLRPYHERVKGDIEHFGGTVEKFIGDAVMAVFGAPVAHEDDAERAIRAGLRVLETIEGLAEEGLELAIRAAVTTGEAVVALGARPERGEGIVTGDVVNTAARLQSAAPVGGVLVDELTMRSAEPAITFEPLEPVEAKGKSSLIPVWRVVGARSRVGQPEAAVRSPFVGREHERAVLLETFLRAERESSVQLVTVVGEPGIGKSRLVTEIRTALDERPDLVTWRHGRCLPYGEGITFWALGEIVKAEAGILESDDPQVAAAKLDEILTALFPDESDRAWFASRLGPLVGAGGEGGAVAREEAFTAWRRFLEAMAARRPCVFVLEDLHWADGALLEFVEHVLDWSPPVPALLLCTARPELFERSPSWGGGQRNATTISLSPLSTDESGRLLHLLLERAVLPVETQSLLLERTGGNPLYAEQFARMLVDRADVENLAVPETVQALITARLDTLPPELKAVLQDASVVGRVFWTGAVAEMSGRARDDVRRDLNELARREFVRPIRVSSIDGEDELSFWHALVRDVAYQQIPRSPRAEKHVAAAAWIESTAGERSADHAEILVHHYEQAMELSRAAGAARGDLVDPLGRVLVLAGDRAMSLDIPAAAAAYRRALGLMSDEAESARVLVKIGDALQPMGELAESEAAYERAIPQLLATGQRRAAGLAMASLGRALWRHGKTQRAREMTEKGVRLLEEDRDAALVFAYGRMAAVDAIGGRSEPGIEWANKAIELADEIGVENICRALGMRGIARVDLGDTGGLDDLRSAVDIALSLNLPAEDTAIAYGNLGEQVGRFEGIAEGRTFVEAGLEFARSRGHIHHVMYSRNVLLWHLFHEGRWDHLLEESSDVIEWDRQRGGTQLEPWALADTGQVLAHRGEGSRAGSLLAAVLPWAREIGDPQSVLPLLSTAAVVALASGDPSAADALLAEYEDRIRERQALPEQEKLCVWVATVALAVGGVSRAEAVVSGFRPLSSCGRIGQMHARALLADASGRQDEAAQLFAEAADGWRTWGSVPLRAYALLGLGACADDAPAVEEGRAIFALLGAEPVGASAELGGQQQV
jgi:class 3 adenylate cyclase/tetratricopeptide (TPR) repeat protein